MGDRRTEGRERGGGRGGERAGELGGERRLSRRPCTDIDVVTYYTLWPILSFSFFMATDEMIDDDYANGARPAIHGVMLFLRTIIHMFALNTLMLTILEIMASYLQVHNILCKRDLLYIEIDSVVSGVALIGLTFVNVLNNYYDRGVDDPPLDRTTQLMCELGAWLLSLGALLYQALRLARHHDFFKACSPR